MGVASKFSTNEIKRKKGIERERENAMADNRNVRGHHSWNGERRRKKNDIAGAGRDGCGPREQGPTGLWASGERVVRLTRWG